MKAYRRIIARKIERKGYPDGYKTPCVCACLECFDVYKDQFRYAHTMADVVRILRRRGLTVRSRTSFFKGLSVGRVRARSRSLIGRGVLGPEDVLLVGVPSHVLLLDAWGSTIVDTDPRKRDRRPTTQVYKIGGHVPKLNVF